MSIRVTAATITVGEAYDLSITRGEDREFRLTFQIDGAAVDMTGATSVVMTVKNRTTGILVFARSYDGFQGGASAGTPRFTITQSDTTEQAEGPYDVDVTWTDADDYKTQLLVASTFQLLKRVGAADDDLTTPAAIPVVYGLDWEGEWTGRSGGYFTNDAVYADDGSLGATAVSSFRAVASGVTVHPITASLTVASGWVYIAQHGGVATGPAGVDGATGPTGPAGATQLPDISGNRLRTLRVNSGATGVEWTNIIAHGASHGLLQIGANIQNSNASHNNWFRYQPNETGPAPWLGWFSQFTNDGNASRMNQTWAFGYNFDSGGGRRVASEPAMGWAIESLYQPTGGNAVMEPHLIYVKADGSQSRMLSGTADIVTDETTMGSLADNGRFGKTHHLTWGGSNVSLDSSDLSSYCYVDDNQVILNSGGVRLVNNDSWNYSQGHFIAFPDDTYDLGSGGLRFSVGRFPRGIEVGSSGGARPTASSSTRGRIFAMQGASGVLDGLYWAVKTPAETYEWWKIDGGQPTGAPTLIAGGMLGTVSGVTVDGTIKRGRVKFTTGSSTNAPSGLMLTLSFPYPFAYPSGCMGSFQAANANAGKLFGESSTNIARWVTATSTGLSLHLTANGTTGGLSSSTEYELGYEHDGW